MSRTDPDGTSWPALGGKAFPVMGGMRGLGGGHLLAVMILAGSAWLPSCDLGSGLTPVA